MNHRLFIFAVISLLFLPVSIGFCEEGQKAAFKISSAAFENNTYIPRKYTCDGADINPPLRIENVPPSARSLALIVDDPDAPGGVWVHWVVWNIDPSITEIKENSVPKGGMQGQNDFRKNGYGGPCPPATHRYFFKVFALDTVLSHSARFSKSDLEKAMRGHVVAQTHLIGIYGRK